VIVGGERRYAMRVWIDQARLASYGLTPADVEAALRSQNAEIPSGRVEGAGREFSVRTRGDLRTAEEFANVVVLEDENRLVRLADVADVRLGPEDDRTVARFDQEDAVGLGIVKQSKASTLDVAARVREALPALREALPPGVKLAVAYDSSVFIQNSIDEVRTTIFVAILLVVLVIFLFLKSLRATAIPALAIPASIVGAFAVAYFMGFTVNILTLLALVLAIGLVVDDAIVVLENIFRHMEMGKPRRRAAFDGSAEIGFAVVATTVSLVAVFVPVAFLTGKVGRLFNEFAITVAVAVLISGFVALTLTPMLCSRMLQPLHAAAGRETAFDRFFDAIDRIYERSVRTALRFRWAAVLGAVGVVLVAVVLFRVLPGELVPTEDRGTILAFVIAPEGATLDYTQRYMEQVEGIFRRTPEVRSIFSAVGLGFGAPGRVTDGIVFAMLKDPAERKRRQQEVTQELFPQLLAVPGVLAFAIDPPSLGGEFSATPVQFVLQAESYDDLQKATSTFLGKAAGLGYLLNLDTDLKLNKPQLEVDIDRDRAAQLGVSVADIGIALQTLLGGREVTDFKRGTKQYDVIAQLRPSERATPSAIEGIYVRGRSGLIQLASVVRVRETVAPKELNHFNRVRSATITANLAPGVTLGRALADLRRIARAELPASVRADLRGQSREFSEASGSLFLLFGLAVVFIFLVLAGQFESFIHPFTILLTVPLAVFGALVSLFVFRMSINLYSQIGLIMLIGLVTKNAILIVEYANQLRARGLDAVEGTVQAARIRLRPILMTSFSTIFGTLPIALGFGAGAEARKPLGVAVVGGMLFSTFLTLLLVPVVYALLARFTRAGAREEAPGEETSRTPAGDVIEELVPLR
jgi:multidrug efflux pump